MNSEKANWAFSIVLTRDHYFNIITENNWI